MSLTSIPVSLIPATSRSTLFLWCEPLAGHRHIGVTDHRTLVDWAHAIRDLVDVRSPDTERVVLVLDNLNIHSLAKLIK
jgi:hypothetical protein